jgi:hypothetical protein
LRHSAPAKARDAAIEVKGNERTAHFGGMFLVDAEDDGLGVAAGLAREVAKGRVNPIQRSKTTSSVKRTP